ncbi:hypothetical protein B0H14DRAFT_3479305 [Mycena olivaceomarginata]|nr:hypothetical protein B0H14DRAFT_3479305 [Mycena olivaceomarginata]
MSKQSLNGLRTCGHFVRIRDPKATHVTFFTTTLQEVCEYNSLITEVNSFVKVTGVLELVRAAAAQISFINLLPQGEASQDPDSVVCH